MTTPQELSDEMLRLSRLIDDAQMKLVEAVHEEATAEHEFRKARANAYLSTSGTVGEREAQTDKTVADEKHRAHLAAGLAKAQLEAVRNLRGQLSALQSISGAVREEMRFSRTAPEEVLS